MISGKRLFLLYRSYEPNTAIYNRALNYISCLSEMGVETIVCFFLPNKNFDKVEKQYKNVKFIYYWDKYYFKGKYLKYLSYFIYQKSFLANLRSGDVVYVYGMQELLKPLSQKKEVKTFHERTELPTLQKMGTHLHWVSIEEYLSACRNIDGLIVISQGLKDYFVKEGVQDSNISVINMTVDPQRFNELKKTPNERYIAYCGTVSNNKDGVDDLIRAFSQTVRKHPDVKLYIIGPIPSKVELDGNIQLINELGIQDKVVLTGVVSTKDMPKILKNAEVLALARPDNLQAKYGFPTKLGEYLLTENPVVITKVGDIPLFLEDGKSALLCEPGNYNEFSNKLCWALENHENARIIGMKGAEVARECFNSEIETKKLVKVLYGNQ